MLYNWAQRRARRVDKLSASEQKLCAECVCRNSDSQGCAELSAAHNLYLYVQRTYVVFCVATHYSGHLSRNLHSAIAWRFATRPNCMVELMVPLDALWGWLKITFYSIMFPPHLFRVWKGFFFWEWHKYKTKQDTFCGFSPHMCIVYIYCVHTAIIPLSPSSSLIYWFTKPNNCYRQYDPQTTPPPNVLFFDILIHYVCSILTPWLNTSTHYISTALYYVSSHRITYANEGKTSIYCGALNHCAGCGRRCIRVYIMGQVPIIPFDRRFVDARVNIWIRAAVDPKFPIHTLRYI